MIALVVMASTGLTAVPAAANHTVCDSGEFCIWENPNYGGDFWGADRSDPDWPCGWICHPNLDNNEDSLKNLTGVTIDVFDADNYGGGVNYCVPAGVWENDIAGDRDNDGNSSKPRSSFCPLSLRP